MNQQQQEALSEAQVILDGYELRRRQQDAYKNPLRPESDVVAGDLGACSRPFPAKFSGVCAWSGDRFQKYDKIRMLAGLDRLNDRGCQSLPVLEAWLAFQFGRECFWVESVDQLLAELDACGKLWVWNNSDRSKGKVVGKNSDGTYYCGWTGKRSKAQIINDVLRHARVFKRDGVAP